MGVENGRSAMLQSVVIPLVLIILAVLLSPLLYDELAAVGLIAP